jgi:hypothetical protein
MVYQMTYVPSTSVNFGRRAAGDGETLAASDPTYIVVTAIATFITINLPLANSVPAGKTFIFKDESGNNASFGPIIIARSGSDTIDGSTTKSITTDYGSLTVYSDGTSKWLIA